MVNGSLGLVAWIELSFPDLVIISFGSGSFTDLKYFEISMTPAKLISGRSSRIDSPNKFYMVALAFLWS